MLLRDAVFAALVPAVLLAGPAAAQVRDTTGTDVIRIRGITVQAQRQQVRAVGGTSAVDVRIDSIVMAPAPRLEQILRNIPAVHVRTNSRGEAEISVRGSESRQVAVLVDGVPLTLQWDGRTDVSVVPATAVQEMRFTRGLSSVLYGPNVLGGVVEMSVAHASMPEAPLLSVGAGLEGTGGRSSAVSTSIPIRTGSGSWLIRGGIGYRDSPGQPLADGVVEPVQPATLEPGLRLNTDYTNRDGFLALRYNHDETGAWFSFTGSGYSGERGIAAELENPEPRLWRYPRVSRLIAAVSGGTGQRTTPFGTGDIEASIGLDVGRTEIIEYESRAYAVPSGFEDGDDRTLTARLLADHTLGDRADLRTAFTFADIFHREILPNGTSEYQQRLMSLGGETVFRLVDGPGMVLRLSTGGVFDVASTPKTGGKPSRGTINDWGARIALAATVNGGNTLLHAGASRRVRFPALRETYSGALNRFDPNPDLKAENLVAMEAGVTTRLANSEVQVVGFHHRLNDAIVRITTPQNLFRRVNRNQVRSTGIELVASRELGPVSVGGDLTLQSVDLIDPTSTDDRHPENLPSVLGSVHATVPAWFNVLAAAKARFVGDSYCLNPDGEEIQLDGGALVDGNVSRVWRLRPSGASWVSRLETRISVDNVMDTAVYDQCGLPQPGRLLRFEVRLF